MARIADSEAVVWRPSRRLLAWGCAFLLATVVAMLGFWWFRGFRADQLAEQAQRLAEEGRSVEAWEKVRAARQLRPTDLEVVRAAARIAEQVDATEARRLWAEARDISGGEAEDIHGQIRVALSTKAWSQADTLLTDLRVREGDSSGYRIRRAQWHAGQGEPVAAVDMASLLLTDDEVTSESHWFFINTALASPRASDQRRARQHLRDLALLTHNPSLARDALRRFSRLPELSEGELDFAVRLWDQLAVTREDKLLALELQLAQPGTVDRTPVERAARLFNLGEGAERVAFGRWLNQQELYEATLDYVPEEMAISRRDLFLVRLDSLALLDRWGAVQKLLSTQRAPLHTYLEELFRMRAYFELGEAGRAHVAWQRALQAARREAVQLRFLARYTQNLGLIEFTEEALWALVEEPGWRRSGFETLLAIYEQRQDAKAVLSVLDAMHRDFPGDYAVANDWAYYSILLDENMEAAKLRIEKLIELNPELLAHRMTRVLAHLKDGEAAKALRVVESLAVADWTRVKSARWRALLAVVLARNGRMGEAERALRGIDASRLLPEEAAMVASALENRFPD